MAAPGAGPGLEVALQKLALRRKKVLSAEEMELYELAQAAGGAIDPDVFKILVDLLKLNVAPLAVFQMLKSMCAGQRPPSESQDPTAGTLPPSSLPETREASFLSAENCKPPARPSFSSAPRPAASPVLLHSSAAAYSPLSPGPPSSLRFSCCLFSPFAGCVYWFISGGWCALLFPWKPLWSQKARAAFGFRSAGCSLAVQLRDCGQFCSSFARTAYTILECDQCH
ncbi:mitotic-spindle organizing protein 2B isoform X1 [Erinaceus europaeus]|uniref:Mitotic-spindle organizing protein 2B isoform X1 n=1 Tax=Erinaceus europaeus TaxID=9365 RepID=A0ABM3XMV0_ERIEU|nr:mitotic-spindle organizing protein 2B isoform X1 [Erinaceus europaeus]